MKISSETVYLTDNGAAYCGAHLGYTARTTGRDLSGQKILPLTPELAAEAGGDIACEKCGKKASLLYIAGA